MISLFMSIFGILSIVLGITSIFAKHKRELYAASAISLLIAIGLTFVNYRLNNSSDKQTIGNSTTVTAETQ